MWALRSLPHRHGTDAPVAGADTGRTGHSSRPGSAAQPRRDDRGLRLVRCGQHHPRPAAGPPRRRGRAFRSPSWGAHLSPEKTLGWVTAPCRSTCPSNVDCPSYIFQVAEGHPFLATALVKRDNPLPMVIGRTCHHPCESNCTLQQVGQPIAINSLKRWAADRAEGLVPVAAGPTSVGPWGPAAGPHEAAEAETAEAPAGAGCAGRFTPRPPRAPRGRAPRWPSSALGRRVCRPGTTWRASGIAP